jgi:hypothetical protein
LTLKFNIIYRSVKSVGQSQNYKPWQGCFNFRSNLESTYPLDMLTQFDKVKTQDVGKTCGLLRK